MKRSSAAALAVASLMPAGGALLASRASLAPAWAQAFVDGASIVQSAIGWTESYNGPVAASASLDGATRVGGTMGGTPYNLDRFQVTVYSSAAGILCVFG